MNRTCSTGTRLTITAVLLMPLNANAGMAMPRFTDVAAARLNVVSFFLVGYLLLALVYQRIWNSLSRDFQKMPRLSYRGALGGLIVCGLFIYVVLTMISGARELMTPGAWARSGVLYKIREPEREPKPWLDSARRASLEGLRADLWQYAEKHGGKFPASRESADLAGEMWRSIDPNGLLFVYFPGLKPDVGQEVLAYEPGSFGASRFALLTNGEIVEIKTSDLIKRVQDQIRSMDSATQEEHTP